MVVVAKEDVVCGRDVHHLLVLPDVQRELVGDALVVAQRFAPRRLVTRDDEGHTADLQPVGRAEERHPCGVPG
jgi:hypothetical protein